MLLMTQCFGLPVEDGAAWRGREGREGDKEGVPAVLNYHVGRWRRGRGVRAHHQAHLSSHRRRNKTDRMQLKVPWSSIVISCRLSPLGTLIGFQLPMPSS